MIEKCPHCQSYFWKCNGWPEAYLGQIGNHDLFLVYSPGSSTHLLLASRYKLIQSSQTTVSRRSQPIGTYILGCKPYDHRTLRELLPHRPPHHRVCKQCEEAIRKIGILGEEMIKDPLSLPFPNNNFPKIISIQEFELWWAINNEARHIVSHTTHNIFTGEQSPMENIATQDHKAICGTSSVEINWNNDQGTPICNDCAEILLAFGVY